MACRSQKPFHILSGELTFQCEVFVAQHASMVVVELADDLSARAPNSEIFCVAQPEGFATAALSITKAVHAPWDLQHSLLILTCLLQILGQLLP